MKESKLTELMEVRADPTFFPTPKAVRSHLSAQPARTFLLIYLSLWLTKFNSINSRISPLATEYIVHGAKIAI